MGRRTKKQPGRDPIPCLAGHAVLQGGTVQMHMTTFWSDSAPDEMEAGFGTYSVVSDKGHCGHRVLSVDDQRATGSTMVTILFTPSAPRRCLTLSGDLRTPTGLTARGNIPCSTLGHKTYARG